MGSAPVTSVLAQDICVQFRRISREMVLTLRPIQLCYFR